MNNKGIPVPWKDPNTWLRAEVVAPILAFVLSFLMTLYRDDKTTPTKRVLEASIGGLIGLSAKYVVSAMGIHGDWQVVIAVVVAIVGVRYIQDLVKNFLSKKVSK